MFGIDCASDSRTLLDQAEARYGHIDVVGRYLRTIAGVSTGLSMDEVAWLHARGKAIAVICNDDQVGSIIGSGDYTAGATLAREATILAAQLGVPHGVRIFFDVETGFWFSVQAALGMVHATAADGYLPAFYNNPVSGRNHAGGYRSLRELTPGVQVRYWTCQHEWTANLDQAISTFVVDDNNAAGVAGYESECIGWQTAIDRPPGVDLDCWRSREGLWLPMPAAPPKPPVWHVTAYSALKVYASHASVVAIDEKHRPVVLELGAIVVPTSQKSGTWVEVRLPDSPVHGWLEAESIRQGAS